MYVLRTELSAAGESVNYLCKSTVLLLGEHSEQCYFHWFSESSFRCLIFLTII